MKTQKKKGEDFYLQKTNKRWKWMAAATAAGATASQASAITINLVNNYISATGGNHLNADLTGDGHPDLTIANAFNSVSVSRRTSTSGSSTFYYTYNVYRARVNLNGVYAFAFRHSGFLTSHVVLGSQFDGSTGTGYATLTGTIPIFFKDLHINGGAPTEGSLEVTVTGGRPSEVQLDSFTYTFNTPGGSVSSTVPEHGSSLALLAMGAGGVLALRRWRTAREPA